MDALAAVLFHVLGLDDASGPWYLFWSGFGSDASKLAILGGLAHMWRHHLRHHHGNSDEPKEGE